MKRLTLQFVSLLLLYIVQKLVKKRQRISDRLLNSCSYYFNNDLQQLIGYDK